EPDILFAADPWFRGIDLCYGPDGNVYVLDWSDTGECHDHDGVHRNSGRIYRIAYGAQTHAWAQNVRALAERELVALHDHGNEWFVRKARLVLGERSVRGDALPAAKAALPDLVKQSGDPARRVRALCTLYAIGGAEAPFLRTLLHDEHESVRAWAIRMLTDGL